MARQTSSTGYYQAEEPPPLFAQPVAQPSAAAVSQASSPAFKPLPKAVDVSAAVSGRRRRQILMVLSCHGERALFEICELLRCEPNQISGRITDLKRDACIDIIGQRPHPRSHVGCDVYAITAAGELELGKAGTR